ncbi:MAG: putative DCC family thiol-disulfide oxidoreductase YuxK [Bermanella sp.]|jgi:predicted DCC family thiol-disulfide oxidoreductase YuxK
MSNSKKDITVFYDGQCPLCSWEIDHLKKKDVNQRIGFEDIHGDEFATKHPNLNKQQLDNLLHVQQSDGQFQTGIDATYLLWQTVGMGKWFAPLKWKWLRVVLKPSYLLFARYRHSITALLFPVRTYRARKKATNHE